MEDMLREIISNEDRLMLVIGGAIAVIWIVIGTIGKVLTNVSRERTKREIAAYIAEGSISPDQGERLVKADRPRGCC
ncbi:MAG: hypothetical protein ACIARR_10050 [Phycisphaerales bacterium JB059]